LKKSAALVTALAGLATVATLALAGPPKLKQADVEFDGVGGVEYLADVNDVAISRDGDFVYVTSSSENAVSVFARNRREKVRFVQARVDGQAGVDNMAGSQDVAIAPDGRFAYVAGYEDDALVIFKRSGNTGKLSYKGAKVDGAGAGDALAGAQSVTISRDSRFIYVGSSGDPAVTVFRRTRAGKHRFVAAYENDTGAIEDMGSPWGSDITGDGKFLYVASESAQVADPGAIVVFKRNGKTGKLRFVQAIEDGEQGADYIAGAFVADVAPGDRHVYVASESDDSLTVFKRKPRSGKLRVIQVKRNGVGDVTGLDAPYDVIVTPDGRSAYTLGYDDDSLIAFKRNSKTGKLRFDRKFTDGVDGIEGIDGIWRIAGDNNGVFGGAYSPGNSVAAFKRTR